MSSFKLLLVCILSSSGRAEANKADAAVLRRNAKGVDGDDDVPSVDASGTFQLETSDKSYVLPTEPGTYTKVLPDGSVKIANLDQDDSQGDGVHIYVGRGSGNCHNEVDIDVETSGDGTYIYVAEGDGNCNNTAKITVDAGSPESNSSSDYPATKLTTNDTESGEGIFDNVEGGKSNEGIDRRSGDPPDIQWLGGLNDTDILPGTYLKTYPNGTVLQANLDRDNEQGDGVHLYLAHGIGNSNNYAEAEIDTTGDGTYIYIAEGQDNQYNKAKITVRAGRNW